jgi:Flp pilus assembly protein TadG
MRLHRRFHRLLQRICQEDQGSILVEFAVFLSVTLLILAGIADLGYYIHAKTELENAAAAGALYGTIPTNQMNGTYMQASAVAAAPDLSGVTATPSNFYACTPGGTHVTASTMCTNTENGTAYGTPIMYVEVTTSATVPAVLKWTGIATSLALQGQAIYRIPWVNQ